MAKNPKYLSSIQHTHTHTCARTHIHTRTRARAHAHTHARAHAHTRTHIRACAHTLIHTHTHTPTHTRALKHTHIHTLTHIRARADRQTDRELTTSRKPKFTPISTKSKKIPQYSSCPSKTARAHTDTDTAEDYIVSSQVLSGDETQLKSHTATATDLNFSSCRQIGCRQIGYNMCAA